MTYHEWTTWRSSCGQARITYHSEWDPTKPFATFKRGTAGAHFPSLATAVQALVQAGYEFKTSAPAVAGESHAS